MTRTRDPLAYPALLMERLEAEVASAIREHPMRFNSAFRMTEATLGRGKYQAALKFVGATAAMGGYREVIDFLFCELFPEYRAACMAYYAGEGPSLNETLDAETVRRCDRAMLCLLAVASAIREDADYPGRTCPVRWATVVATARELAAMAPRRPTPAPQ